MTLKTCVDIAEECGLETLGEAILNIDMHCLSIFNYDEMKDELGELYSEYNNLFNSGVVTTNTTLSDYKKTILVVK